MGSFYSTSPAVSIISPAEGHKYVLDTYEKTAKVLELADGQKELVIASKARTAGDTDKAMVAAELRSKIETDVRVREPMVVVEAGGSGMSVRSSAPEAWVATRYETKTEELGTRDFDGIAAEGTRRVTTIPAGAIGNELPIETVYERWFSKELGMVVYSKNSDPRFGEQTYKLTNIVRSEPDQSLFSVPTEYRKILEPTTVYRISEAGPQSRPTVITKGVNAAPPVKKTKP